MLKQANGTGVPVQSADETVRKQFQADSWAFYKAYFPTLIERLGKLGLVRLSVRAGTVFLATNPSGKALLKKPKALRRMFREEFEDGYRSLQVAELKSMREAADRDLGRS